MIKVNKFQNKTIVKLTAFAVCKLILLYVCFSVVCNFQPQVALGVTATTKNLKANDGNLIYSASDLMIGDYIQDFGGITWRVVDDANLSTNGLVLRSDGLIKTTRWDFEIEEDSPRAFNRKIRRQGTEDFFDMSGSSNNFYYETEIRRYLNDEFLTNFSQIEINQISVVPKEYTVYPGLFKQNFELSGGHKLEALTSGAVLGTEEDKFVNRFASTDQLGGTGLTLKEPEGALDSVGLSYTESFDSVNTMFAKLRTYELNDMVYVPSILDFLHLYSNTNLKNKLGSSYAAVVSSEGKAVYAQSTTPLMGNGWVNGSYNSQFRGDSYFGWTGADKLGVHRMGSTNLEIGHCTLMLHLKPDTMFFNTGEAALNPGEIEESRPSVVGAGDTGYRNFVLYDGGEILENLVESDFGDLKTGDLVDIELFGTGHSVTSVGLGLYVDVKDGKEHILGRIGKAGKVSLRVLRQRSEYMEPFSTALEFDIEKGTFMIRVPTGLTAREGQELSTIDLPIEGVGTWRWQDPTDTVASGKTYTAIFTPNDLDNYNIEIREVPIDLIIDPSPSFMDETMFWVLLAGAIGGLFLGFILYMKLRSSGKDKNDKGAPPTISSRYSKYTKRK